MRKFLGIILLAATTLSTLAACQNLAGVPGVQPANCAVPGSSCSRDGGGR